MTYITKEKDKKTYLKHLPNTQSTKSNPIPEHTKMTRTRTLALITKHTLGQLINLKNMASC